MKKLLLLLIALLTLSVPGLAQTANQYFQAGNAHYRDKRYDQAIVQYTRSIELNPKESKTWFNRGQCHFFKKDYNLAIADYTKSLELNATYVDCLFQRALAHDRTENHQIGRASCRERV